MTRPQAQIGFKVDPDYEAQLQQALALTGKDRATFARDAVRAAMLRVIGGEEPEGAAAARIEPADAASTIRWLERTLVDFKQIADDHRRQSAELRKLRRGEADAMHRARTEFLEGYPDRILKSTKPVHDRLAELSGKLDDLPGIAGVQDSVERIGTAIRSALEELARVAEADRAAMAAEAQRTRALVEDADRPRTTTVYNIGLGDWSRGVLLAGAIGIVSLGIVAFALLATILPDRWLALPATNKVLGGGDQAICRMIDYQYGTGRPDCRVVVKDGTVVVSASRSGPRR
jgi:uncharacterized protein (DUF1778 family)